MLKHPISSPHLTPKTSLRKSFKIFQGQISWVNPFFTRTAVASVKRANFFSHPALHRLTVLEWLWWFQRAESPSTNQNHVVDLNSEHVKTIKNFPRTLLEITILFPSSFSVHSDLFSGVCIIADNDWCKHLSVNFCLPLHFGAKVNWKVLIKRISGGSSSGGKNFLLSRLALLKRSWTTFFPPS